MEEVPGPKGSGSLANGSENEVGKDGVDDTKGANAIGCILTPGPGCAASGMSQTLEGFEVPESMKSSRFGSSLREKDDIVSCTASEFEFEPPLKVKTSSWASSRLRLPSIIPS
jgi:hypothetical protein